MLTSLRHNLGQLFVFSGRTTRGRFWPYAAAVIALVFVAIPAAMIPTITDMFARVRRFAAEHPDQVTEIRGPGSYEMQIEGYHPELMPDLGRPVIAIAIIALAALLLLAAAVARRLHDRDKSGWWGAPTAFFLAIGLGLTPYMFARFSQDEPDMSLFFLLFLNNLAYLASLLVLFVLLLGPGTPGLNRYGEQPD